MPTTPEAQNALALLWEAEWFAMGTKSPETEATENGGYTIWCESEVYRISPEGEVVRVYVNSAERVIL
ncbi:hypothetical protein SEA_CECE_343 [Microbacterium phage Cece]|nr:hypothetical protein SEA_CECE_41 [Microbacterium phage Cece]UVG35349.1 hypothetical protein SEA_CECE_343 [Microbacterium phage Cece]